MATETQMATATATEQTQATADCPMKAEPQKEHEWLQQLVGEWTCEGEAAMQPDQPPVKWSATETVRSLGGMWVVGESKSESPQGQATMIITLGYEPRRERYVGTFIGSPMNHMWVYEGTVDESGKVLTLNTQGPGMDPKGPLANYRDIVEIKSAEERTLTSFMEAEGGQWVQLMSATYRRK